MKREEFYTKVAQLCEGLANPLRMQIFLKILSEGCNCDIKTQEGFSGNCVSGIMKELDLPQSTVSTYLKSLTSAGLIECHKKGKFLYCVPSKEALRILKTFADGGLAQISAGAKR